MSATDAEAKEYTERLLTETREELVRADTKASLLFAVSGVLLAAFLAGVINGEWTPGDLDKWATGVFALGAVLYLIAVVALGSAVWPRVTHKEAKRSADYFGDIVAYKGQASLESLKAALRRSAENADRPTSQLLIISGIVDTKYAGIRVAIGFFIASFSACTAAILLG
ncbi:MAG: hypothetical protein QOJ81_760 [Chloroflexota bacterium]|jgi:hypothetical protein|nr:hypothetical protein [Chloroflexota bacterium]